MQTIRNRSPYRWLGLLVFVLTAWPGCGKVNRAENESETHFLLDCSDSCPSGLECWCGVCTKPCEDDDACSDWNEAARCMTADGEICGDESPAMTCDVACEEQSECMPLGQRFSCVAGRCREAEGEPPDPTEPEPPDPTEPEPPEPDPVEGICPTGDGRSDDPIVEICAADLECCACGCGPEPCGPAVCEPGTGTSCGTQNCREGYVCCNAICGVCAEDFEDCVVTEGRCSAIGMNADFDQCAVLVDRTDIDFPTFRDLDEMMRALHGRWIACQQSEYSSYQDSKVWGVDFTSDGQYFLLERTENGFSRIDDPAARGSVVGVSEGYVLETVPATGSPQPALGVHQRSLALFDEPRALHILPGIVDSIEQPIPISIFLFDRKTEIE